MAAIIPFTVRSDGIHVLLGLRRDGECEGWWTEFASDLDMDSAAAAGDLSGTTLLPRQLAARAAYMAAMGMLGTQMEIESSLRIELRAHLPSLGLGAGTGRGYIYALPVASVAAGLVAQLYTQVSHFAEAHAYTRDRSSGRTVLINCPPTLFRFSRMRWLPLSQLEPRLQASLTRGPRSAIGASIAPRTIEALRHLVPLLRAASAATLAGPRAGLGSGGDGSADESGGGGGSGESEDDGKAAKDDTDE